jgi:hypothetical protein
LTPHLERDRFSSPLFSAEEKQRSRSRRSETAVAAELILEVGLEEEAEAMLSTLLSAERIDQ